MSKRKFTVTHNDGQATLRWYFETKKQALDRYNGDCGRREHLASIETENSGQYERDNNKQYKEATFPQLVIRVEY